MNTSRSSGKNKQMVFFAKNMENAEAFFSRPLRLGYLLLVLVMGVACARPNYPEKRVDIFDFAVTPETSLAINNVNGNVRIESRDGVQRVHVEAVVRAKTADDLARLSVKVSQKGTRIALSRHGEKKGWFSSSPKGRIDFRVTAPPDIVIDAVDTVNGNVTVLGNRNRVDVDTVNGNVDMQHLAGSASVDMVNGDALLQLDTLAAGQKIAIDTVNGDVVLRLPAEASARLEANTVNGHIQAKGFPAKKESGFVGKSVEATIGSGEAHVELNTVNGDMKVIRQQR